MISSTIKDFVRRHKYVAIIGGLALGLFAYSKIESMYDPVIEGKVVQEAVIPRDIPENLQEFHPYWVDVQTKDYGVLRLHFDTKGITNLNRPRGNGFLLEASDGQDKLRLRVGIPTDFEGKTLVLESLIQVGDTIKAKVDERSGVERHVESIQGVYR